MHFKANSCRCLGLNMYRTQQLTEKWYQGGYVQINTEAYPLHCCCSWKPHLLLCCWYSWPTAWIQMECIFLWQFHHTIQVLWSLIWSVQFASYQANLFLDSIPTWLQETFWRRFHIKVNAKLTQLSCWAIDIHCICLPKDDVVNIDNTNHFGSHKETRIKPGLLQSTGFKPFGSVLPKCSWTLTKSIQGLLQLEGLSGPICSILWKTQRHCNINSLTWFKISMKESTKDIALLRLQSEENLQDDHKP